MSFYRVSQNVEANELSLIMSMSLDWKENLNVVLFILLDQMVTRWFIDCLLYIVGYRIWVEERPWKIYDIVHREIVPTE